MSLLSIRLPRTFFTLCTLILCALPLFCSTAVSGPARLNPVLSFGKVYQAVKTAPKQTVPGVELPPSAPINPAPEKPSVQSPTAETVTDISQSAPTESLVQSVKIQPPPPSPREKIQSDQYRIGIGDILTISIWQNLDLTRQLTVLPDGKIHFPLAGTVTAQGQTVAELSDAMHEKLKPYVLDPELTVTVDKARSMMIYVIGKINRPGSFDINEPVDVLQAISMAGGINPFADKDEIKIFRGSLDQTQIFPFDYSKVTKGRQQEQNILLSRGDVIVVP